MICLQGGGEFSAGCRAMDTELVRRAGGRVVVTALAGTPGRDYDTATAHGVRHFLAIAAPDGPDVVGAPDARSDRAGALDAVRSARLLVLPGGSPSRLLTALRDTGLDEAIRRLLADGGVVMGASAGAMVLCPWTVLPDDLSATGPQVVAGLGLTPELLVVPHWRGASPWLGPARSDTSADTMILGIPEESGVLVEGDLLTAVGTAATRLVPAERDLPPGESWSLV